MENPKNPRNQQDASDQEAFSTLESPPGGEGEHSSSLPEVEDDETGRSTKRKLRTRGPARPGFPGAALDSGFASRRRR